MTKGMDRKVAVVTGAAGFIGYHVALLLLQNGWKVIGLSLTTTMFSLNLVEREITNVTLTISPSMIKLKIQVFCLMFFPQHQPETVIHLAAQAGVRHSIEDPRSYLESNVVGTYELLEAARRYIPKHMLMASTSSSYGASNDLPYKRDDKTDHQMSFYAATKKSTENFAHSYSHLYGLPITMFRFFTVYGPWGRPDMALFKFTKAILTDQASYRCIQSW